MSTILNYQQSHLDLNKVESINKSQLVDLINNFTISYLDKLKSLMVSVDSRLFKLNSKIIACQSNLCILEARIASVPGLSLEGFKKDFKTIDVQEVHKSSSQIEETVDQTDSHRDTDLVDEKSEVKQQQQNYESSEEVESAKDLENDPELIKFKKMLKFGIPLGAVQQKMRSEGYDPSLLK